MPNHTLSFQNGSAYLNTAFKNINRCFCERIMNKLSIPILFVLTILVTTSCSYFLSSYEGPLIASHGYVEGVSPSNSQNYQERTYPTVQANWPGPGGDKVWLSRNLGANDEPISSVDDRSGNAGWYFQFNKKQAFHHNGNVPIPQWRFSSIVENSAWDLANDPCHILLGEPWRIPTVEEIRAFHEASRNRGGMGEGNRTDAFNSTLKLHAAGELASFDGKLRGRGENGRLWTSDQFTPSNGEAFGFAADGSGTFGSNKAFGRPVRCIMD